jgi:hypothetical protein
MQTRSQTRSRPPVYAVEIDFDEASAAWKANKVAQGNGMYSYKCMGRTKLDSPCKRKPLSGCDFCKLHKNAI